MQKSEPFDAILLASFGGPERPEDVVPFLENVVRGKNVPEARLQEVAEHYDLFGGISPINEENRALLAAIVGEFNRCNIPLAVYWGNRHWHPTFPEVLQQMADDAIRRVAVFVTSVFQSPASYDVYAEEIERAKHGVVGTPPEFELLPVFYDQPGFIEPMSARVAEALAEMDPQRRDLATLVFTAHSLPQSMADACPYAAQFREAARLVADRLGLPTSAWTLAYQSRSGPPDQPWLGPDVREHIAELQQTHGVQDVVVVPIGFVVEHIEVLYDLDVELAEFCRERDISMVRARTVGADPRFVTAIRKMVEPRL